jgi:glycine oxidase
VIVGGGVVGCATAYELAQSGCDVTLIARDGLAAHASGWNAGNLNPLHGTPTPLLGDALDAFDRHRTIQAELHELGCADYALLAVDRIFLGSEGADRAELEATYTAFSAQAGFAADWLDRASLLRLEPRLAESVACGVLTRGSLSVDSIAFTCSLARAAERCGGRIVHERVVRVAVSSERVTGVQTDGRVFPCDEVVFATGPWVADLRSWLGVDLAVAPVKGEMLRLHLMGEPIAYDLTLGTACLYRRRDGEVWVGGTASHAGLECLPTDEAKECLMEGAARILPEIRGARLVEHAAALRPVAASGPIAERAAHWRNVYIANGGGAKGVLLSVGIARKIRDILMARAEHVDHTALAQRPSVA